MIKANIYSQERLSPQRKNAIQHGLDILGKHIGGVSVNKSALINLPTVNGLVDTQKVGYGKFDTNTPLHFIAAPINSVGRNGNQIGGFGILGCGLTWLNTSVLNDDDFPITTAHEGAHALGYVLPDSPQTRKVSEGHCSDKRCVMYPVAYSMSSVDLHILRATALLETRMFGEVTKETKSQIPPEDFCLPCRADMIDTIDEQLWSVHLKQLGYSSLNRTTIIS